MKRRVLLVDDDPAILRLVAFELEGAGLATFAATTGREAVRLASEQSPAAIVLDLLLPDVGGREVLKELRAQGVEVPIVILTAKGGIEEAVECMRLGAADFVQKPFDGARLVTSVRNALRRGDLEARVETLSKELRRASGFEAIIGNSPALRRTVELLRRAAESDVTVLLEGESGTGKEVAARAIHAESRRCGGPFVAVNCGAIPEGLIESELFGHEKGAFTGAIAARPGHFEEAQSGTIFLDEIGDLRQDLQVKLLRVLQERKVQRVGGSGAIDIDVRVIAATNRDVRAAAAAKQFREDLYYRLAVFPVALPPLRDREGDVLLLADAFMRRFAARHERPVRSLDPAARRALERYAWPGNVRELENVIERAVILEDGPSIGIASLPDEVARAAVERAAPRPPPSGDEAGAIVPLEELERRALRDALERLDWNVTEAALRLGIGRATIYRMLSRHGIRRDRGSEPT
jgi:two-component system response regulator HydG